ncbi:GNAT family N-acetyltransferase [Halalkalibacterium ligniniphilum]|uniref:GNAT family N-acetyltransferase n=1 Tax=Halalkalibacterium ligniniphilum TaxID=1134413 RepID=UPI00034D2ED5|nr:GNAT family N-acetyltransferase [Halalkalibacterium ligniniphilum]
MLIPYKPSQRKIAMGLISYMPKEKDVKKLQKTIDCYEHEESWKLYFWKSGEDFVAVIGLQVVEDGSAELHHLSVNPSFRQEGLGRKIIEEVKSRLNGPLHATKETKNFLNSCQEV